MGKAKPWTPEEINYLYEKWGNTDIKRISKHLGRTESAIINKKDRLGIGRFLENGNYITLRQLFISLGYGGSSSYKDISWVKNRGLPVINKKVRGKFTFKCVRLDDFWEWAEKNKAFLDFSNFEKFALGPEPIWVAEKRKRDKQKNYKIKKTKWTDREVEYLIFLVNEHKYTYPEISKMLGRTDGAVRKKLTDLGILARAVPKIKSKWLDEEIETLKDLVLKGYDYESIGKEIPNKTVKAIRGKIYRLYGTEVLDDIRDRLDNINAESIKKIWSTEEINTLKQKALEGYSPKDISICLDGRSKEAISQQLIHIYGTSDVRKITKTNERGEKIC